MKTGFFKKDIRIKDKLSGYLSEKRAQKLIEDLESSVFHCVHCGKPIDCSDSPPLSLVNCPYCGDLIFVPMDVGDWWVCEPVAAGGFGAVYLGRSKTNPAEKVVVKVLRDSGELKEEDIEAFEHEYEVASSLGSHPNLIR